MSYDGARESEQLRLNQGAIDEFIVRYKKRSVTPGKRKTVFLFPGGLASKLECATAAYDDNNPAQQFQFETAWLTWKAIFDNPGFHLKMTKKPDDTFRDVDDRIIVAEGAIDLEGVTPYSGFTAWCDLNGIDCFVFGWDWRRRLDDSRSFFLDTFLPHFRQRVQDEAGNDIFAGHTYLVGHSAGGMLANLILRSGHSFVDKLDKVITAGTPFYGYAGQLHRWTEGDSLLNGPLDIFRPKIVEVVSSLPGLYALHFVDEATFNDSKAALSSDLAFPISTYPSVDKTTGVPADPYNPQTKLGGLHRRYPPSMITGFDEDELDKAGQVVKDLARPLLPAQLAAKLFCIRGVQPVDDTVGSIKWEFMKPPYIQATAPLLLQEPIIDDPMVPGDGVQPAWTARLASLPKDQWITVKAIGIDHMLMMDHPGVLSELGTLLGV